MRVDISTLSKDKIELLNCSSSDPQMLMYVVGFRYDETEKAIIYTIRVGVKEEEEEDKIDFHLVYVRYSMLLAFDKKIRPRFNQNPHLKQFPPKILLRRMNPDVLVKRYEDLAAYVKNLPIIDGQFKTKEFCQFFKTKISDYM